jgi:hypothetical protein
MGQLRTDVRPAASRQTTTPLFGLGAMGAGGGRGEDGDRQPVHPGDHLVMTATAATRRPQPAVRRLQGSVRRLSRHEVVVARLAVAHDNGAHVSPHLACYKCLHGETPAFIALPKAA